MDERADESSLPKPIEYASKRTPLSRPRKLFTAIVAILFSVFAIGIGLIFLWVCADFTQSYVAKLNPHVWRPEDRAEDEHNAIAFLLCGAVTTIPGIYYGYAGIRELNRKS
jgi:hypothetical protein